MPRAVALKAWPLMMAAVLMAAPALAADGLDDGPEFYTRCAVCHLANGAGVPGAFPPLSVNFHALAAHGEGRRYLQLAVIKGLSGPITVDGRAYRGMMPPQLLDDAGVASVLNHIGTSIAASDTDFLPFTAAEVQQARAGGAALNAAGVARLRPAGGH